MNELDVVRIRLLVWGEERKRIKRIEASLTAPEREPAADPVARGAETLPVVDAPRSTTNVAASSLGDLTDVDPRHPSTFSDPGRETFSERSDRLASSGWSWFTDKLSVLTPLKRIDEREYERRLVELLEAKSTEREQVREEIRQLEDVKKRLDQRQREAEELAEQ